MIMKRYATIWLDICRLTSPLLTPKAGNTLNHICLISDTKSNPNSIRQWRRTTKKCFPNTPNYSHWLVYRKMALQLTLNTWSNSAGKIICRSRKKLIPLQVGSLNSTYLIPELATERATQEKVSYANAIGIYLQRFQTRMKRQRTILVPLFTHPGYVRVLNGLRPTIETHVVHLCEAFAQEWDNFPIPSDTRVCYWSSPKLTKRM